MPKRKKSPVQRARVIRQQCGLTPHQRKTSIRARLSTLWDWVYALALR